MTAAQQNIVMQRCVDRCWLTCGCAVRQPLQVRTSVHGVFASCSQFPLGCSFKLDYRQVSRMGMLGTTVHVATLPVAVHGSLVELSNFTTDVVLATIPASKFSVAWFMMLVVALESMYFLVHSTSVPPSTRTLLCTRVAGSACVYVQSLAHRLKAMVILSGCVMLISALMVLLFGSHPGN